MIKLKNTLQILIVWMLSICISYSQNVTGKILTQNGTPQIGATVLLGDFQSLTNASGIFKFYEVPAGKYTLIVEWEESSFTREGTVVSESITDLGIINITANKGELKSDIAIISINDDDIGGSTDDGGQEYSSLLNAGRDPFSQAAAYNFSGGRFYPRGYNNEDRLLYLNGFAVNDLDDGRVLWGAWGGLNDVLRNQQNTFTLQSSSFSFGGVGGASFIDVRASGQRPQTKIVYNRSNRSYTNRFMVTKSSGEMENGWSYSFSGSRRWGNEGYVAGTFYDAWSLFGTVEKKLSNNQSIGLTVLTSPSKRGRFTGSTQEMYDIAGTNFYNGNWGFQNGKKRNSRAYRTAQPIAILRHDWMINNKTTLMTVVAGQTGKFGSTRLDWYNANDPRPDYYRKLPSYYERIGATDVAADVRAKLTNSEAARQLDWDRMYYINQNRSVTVENANGSGESVTGGLAAYVVEEQRFDNDKFNINTNIEVLANERMTINGGLNYSYENVHNFKVVDDLLGAEFYIDLDEFALRDFPGNLDLAQNDLLNPNRLLKTGDKFGYNYDIVTSKAGGWAQNQISLKKMDIFVAGELSNTSFYREGFYKNGKFPDSSLGKSSVNNFTNYGLKAGLTYKIDGRNYFYGVASLRTRAPFSRFSYLSARTRNQAVKNLTSEKIQGGEIGYVFRYPGIKGRISGYYTTYQDQIKSRSFYHDQERTFVNFVLSGVDKKHQGIEIGLEAKLTSTITFDFAAGIGANQYTSRPFGTYTQDNDANILAEDRVIYIKNFYTPGPQQAYTAGLEYRSPKFWFVNVNVNHFRNIYVDINPDRRTDEAVAGLLLPARQEEFDRVINQQKLPAQFTVDFFAGISKRIKSRYVFVYLSVNNVLNNTDFSTGGFEQGRFDYEEYDTDRFPPRLFYAYGRTFSLGLSLSL
ncbi:MAG: TonB-dependent receptor [Saprospiraceae bacterium]